jgi:hypothetical protein
MENTKDRNGSFYLEEKGHRFAMMAVKYETLSRAMSAFKAAVASKDAMQVNLYDCTDSPVGTLIATSNR